ncbi:MAG: NAD-dependent epimerase/dehydratase family protein [Myxococcales bacterium]|nr:NAD-dependent epimerase/dehydratase family protein [Myxococcales bacterium]
MGGAEAQMRALVTGGGGFLGGAIIDRLLARGVEVRSLARGQYPALEAKGVTALQGDLADEATVRSAAAGCDVVFHVAARPGVWGRFDDFYRPNVLGTRNVIAACREHGIGKLVYTSTPSVVHAGGDLEGVDESAPYPEHFEAHYPATKAEAEQAVLAAHGAELATVALRPHLIWGPGDNHLIPRIVARAKAGRLRLVGAPPGPTIDTTYIDDAADAHLLAFDRLAPDAPCGGRAYFISQGDPQPVSVVINGILAAHGLPPCERWISARAAYRVGALLEFVFRMFRARREPPLTRFVARQLATAHWYDLTAARRDLGYAPHGTVADRLAELKTIVERTGAV